MPYFKLAGGGLILLWYEILTILVLFSVTYIVINVRCKNNQIKKMLYISFFIQIALLVLDNHVVNIFPGGDSRRYEFLGWLNSQGIFIEDTLNYSFWIINPLYRILQYRVPMFIGSMHILLSVLINLKLLDMFKLLKIRKKILIQSMKLLIFFPVTLILRTTLLREVIIVFFLTYSIFNFLKGVQTKKIIVLIKAFLYLFLGSFFHSGVIFVGVGYLYCILKNKIVKYRYKLIMIFLVVVAVLLFKDVLLRKIGGGDVERVIKANNIQKLLNANTGYLRNIRTNSALDVILYLPLFMVFFLFSPMVFEIKNLTSLGVFLFNSSIYFYLVINSIVLLNKIKKYLKKSDKILIIGLILSFIATIMVFSIGTRNFGTAMRHRDKFFFVLVIMHTILKDRYLKLKRKY